LNNRRRAGFIQQFFREIHSYGFLKKFVPEKFPLYPTIAAVKNQSFPEFSPARFILKMQIPGGRSVSANAPVYFLYHQGIIIPVNFSGVIYRRIAGSYCYIFFQCKTNPALLFPKISVAPGFKFAVKRLPVILTPH
jgi:hypothetical protein